MKYTILILALALPCAAQWTVCRANDAGTAIQTNANKRPVCFVIPATVVKSIQDAHAADGYVETKVNTDPAITVDVQTPDPANPGSFVVTKQTAPTVTVTTPYFPSPWQYFVKRVIEPGLASVTEKYQPASVVKLQAASDAAAAAVREAREKLPKTESTEK